jgi:2-polyprenyl-3-methyl-5-hydroxy-6-metoxy-1,4-benzoquinol methylase
MISTGCLNCHGTLIQRLASWCYYCKACRLWQSQLGDVEVKVNTDSPVVNDLREQAYFSLRQDNYNRILDILENHLDLPGKRLLDVGCAHGWFLKEAGRRGLTSVGIEPEIDIARRALAENLDVRVGYFPDALPPEEAFDVVSFNDVFEHLIHIDTILDEVHRRLKLGGVLILNLPTSEGLFYRLGCLLARLRIRHPFERLWQIDYQTPHRFYFNSRNLQELASRHGYALLKTAPLKTLSTRGLWKRIHIEGNRVTPGSLVTFGASYGLALFQGLVPFLSDAMVQVFRRTDS